MMMVVLGSLCVVLIALLVWAVREMLWLRAQLLEQRSPVNLAPPPEAPPAPRSATEVMQNPQAFGPGLFAYHRAVEARKAELACTVCRNATQIICRSCAARVCIDHLAPGTGHLCKAPDAA